MKKRSLQRVISTILCTTMVVSLTSCSVSKGSKSDKPKETGLFADIVNPELSDKHKGEAVESSVLVNKVEGLSEGFIKGMDISSLIAEEQSGVKYHDKDGNEADLLKILKDSGYNYVRVRVWNDPYDANGNGYGGGNNDIDKCLEIGKRATANGIKTLVDFHYSDFWADPNKQSAPKAWANMSIEEKEKAIYEYTKDSLNKLKTAGVDVGMVQIGNETNAWLCGEINWINITALMNSAAKAIREVDKNIIIAVHFADPSSQERYKNYLQILQNFEVDYDVFGTSYYPYWHGSLENLTEILKFAADTYNKKVMVMETSWAYTPDDFDGHANTIGAGANVVKNYSYTLQGQVEVINDVVQAVVNVGDAGIGVCYWEGGWIPVPEGDAPRSEKWEKYGSGWASSYSAEYDPDDAGKWYGGCAWDNQALFDENGNILESLYAFDYCYTGTKCDVAVDEVANAACDIRIGDEIKLPETVTAIYNDRHTEEIAVKWEEITDSAKFSMQESGAQKYVINGVASVGGTDYNVTCDVNMVEPNYVENQSFEDDTEEGMKVWTIEDRAKDDAEHELYNLDKITDAYTGTHALHWYSKTKCDFTVTQKITGLKPGKYKASCQVQGGDTTNGAFKLTVESNGKTYEEPTEVTEWAKFRQPTIENIVVGKDGTATISFTVYAEADGTKGPWGTVDDFLFNPVEKN